MRDLPLDRAGVRQCGDAAGSVAWRGATAGLATRPGRPASPLLIDIVYGIISALSRNISIIYGNISTAYRIISTVYRNISTVYRNISTVYRSISTVYRIVSALIRRWSPGRPRHWRRGVCAPATEMHVCSDDRAHCECRRVSALPHLHSCATAHCGVRARASAALFALLAFFFGIACAHARVLMCSRSGEAEPLRAQRLCCACMWACMRAGWGRGRGAKGRGPSWSGDTSHASDRVRGSRAESPRRPRGTACFAA